MWAYSACDSVLTRVRVSIMWVFCGKLQALILKFSGGFGAAGRFVSGRVEIRELAVYHAIDVAGWAQGGRRSESA